MITHIIYHIPGRKVGCTKDLKYRRSLYQEMDGAVPEIEILEELHDRNARQTSPFRGRKDSATGEAGI